MYAPPIPPPRPNGVAMGMIGGTTMAMSAGESHLDNPLKFTVQEEIVKMHFFFTSGTLLTTHSPTPVAPHPSMPTYRPPATPTYSYVPLQW